MKYALLSLTLCLALVMFCGCELNGVESSKQAELHFKIGEVVDLKIGGKGQIVKIVGVRNQPYWVRVRTDAGIERMWFDEFELEITP